jgi:putative transposase
MMEHMNRKIVFSPDEYYHIYNRGVDKRDVFLDEGDRDRFTRLLYLSQGKKPIVLKSIQGLTLDKMEIGERAVAIGAYVLMSNHFHILLKAKSDEGVTEFMRKLTTGYTMYFNKKRKRSGALFEGAFKAEHVDRDEYLKYLFAYIHLNPVKTIDAGWKERKLESIPRAKAFISSFRYSSYLDYIRKDRIEKCILSQKDFPEYFVEEHSFEDYINEWLHFHEDNQDPRSHLG